MKIEYKNLLFEVFYTFGNRVIAIALGLVTNVVVARCVGPESRGDIATALLVIGLGVQFGNFGLHASNTYETAKNPYQLSMILGNSLVASFLSGLITTLFIFSILIKYKLFNSIDYFVGHIVLLVAIPVGICYLLLQNILLGLNEIAKFNSIELGSRIAGAIFIGAILALNLYSVELIVAASLISSTYGLAYCLYLLKKRINKIEYSWEKFIKSYRYGLMAYFAALFAFVQQRLVLFLLKNDYGSEEVGYFSIGMTIFDLLYLLPLTVGTILFPKFSALENSSLKRNIALKTTVFISLGMLFVAMGSYKYSKIIISTIYGSSFSNASEYLTLLLPGLLCLSIVSILMNYLASVGMPTIVIIAPAIGCVTMFIVYILCKETWGPHSAAIANSSGNAIVLFTTLLYIFYKWKKNA